MLNALSIGHYLQHAWASLDASGEISTSTMHSVDVSRALSAGWTVTEQMDVI